MQTFLKQKISSTSKEQKLILETDLSREPLSPRSPTRVDRIRVKTIDPLLSLSLPPPLVLTFTAENYRDILLIPDTHTHTHTPLLPRSRRSEGFRRAAGTKRLNAAMPSPPFLWFTPNPVRGFHLGGVKKKTTEACRRGGVDNPRLSTSRIRE